MHLQYEFIENKTTKTKRIIKEKIVTYIGKSIFTVVAFHSSLSYDTIVDTKE